MASVTGNPTQNKPDLRVTRAHWKLRQHHLPTPTQGHCELITAGCFDDELQIVDTDTVQDWLDLLAGKPSLPQLASWGNCRIWSAKLVTGWSCTLILPIKIIYLLLQLLPSER
ncbi:TPA: hypothetical protein ACH3X1_012237 [Trebouxia sp. C0004]